jgi:hypothetical protein
MMIGDPSCSCSDSSHHGGGSRAETIVIELLTEYFAAKQLIFSFEHGETI